MRYLQRSSPFSGRLKNMAVSMAKKPDHLPWLDGQNHRGTMESTTKSHGFLSCFETVLSNKTWYT